MRPDRTDRLFANPIGPLPQSGFRLAPEPRMPVIPPPPGSGVIQSGGASSVSRVVERGRRGAGSQMPAKPVQKMSQAEMAFR